MPLLEDLIRTWQLFRDVQREIKHTTKAGTSAPNIVYDTPTSMMSYSPGRSPRVLAQYGYVGNPVVYRAVNIIADECSAIPLIVKTRGVNGKKQENNPLTFLLQQPNTQYAKGAYIAQLVSHWLIAGTSYTYLAYGGTSRQSLAPQAMYQLRPDLITTVADEGGIQHYEYDTGRTVTKYAPELVRPLKFFHPLDELYGLSPLTVAAVVIDRQNEGEQWNASFMKHAARPSGAFVIAGMLGDEEYTRMKREIASKYVGKNNAGTPLLLEGGLQYVQTGNSPLDADWNNSDANAGRKIAMSIGVDPLLLNDKEHSTYSNVKEARIALLDITVQPMMSRILDEWNSWLSPMYGTDIEIALDQQYLDRLHDDVFATSTRVQNEFTKGLLTFNTAQLLTGRTATPWGDFYQMGPQTYVQDKDMQEYLDKQHESRVSAVTALQQLPNSLSQQQDIPPQLQPPDPQLQLAPPKPKKGWDALIPVLHGTDRLTLYALKMQELRTAWQGKLQEALQGHFNNEHSTLTQAMAKGSDGPLIDATLASTSQQLPGIFLKYYANIAEEAATLLASIVGSTVTIYNKQTLSDLAYYAAQRIATLTTTTHAAVTKDAHTIDALYTEYKDSRAASIAHTEVMVASNVGMFLAACTLAAQEGATCTKTWICPQDGHESLHGKIIDLYDKFPGELFFPGDTVDATTCQCSCLYDFKFNAVHDRHGRFGNASGGSISTQISHGQGVLFSDAVPKPTVQKPTGGGAAASSLPIDAIKKGINNGDLQSLDLQEGDNPRYTLVVGGQKMFVKGLEGQFTGADPMLMANRLVASRRMAEQVGLSDVTTPMDIVKMSNGSKYMVQPFIKNAVSGISDSFTESLATHSLNKISDGKLSTMLAYEYTAGTNDRHSGQYMFNAKAPKDTTISLIDFDNGFDDGTFQDGSYLASLARNKSRGTIDMTSLHAFTDKKSALMQASKGINNKAATDVGRRVDMLKKWAATASKGATWDDFLQYSYANGNHATHEFAFRRTENNPEGITGGGW